MRKFTPLSTSRYSYPPDLLLSEQIGRGTRAAIFRGTYRGEEVAVKFYESAFADKYKRRYGLNIARYEFERNLSLYSVPSVKSHAPRPIAILGINDGYSLCFIQEYIPGALLKNLVEECGKLSTSVYEQAKKIVEAAHAAGIYDLDLTSGNIIITPSGEAKMCDFNLLPQDKYPPNPFLKIAYLTGIRKPGHRDRRGLKKFRRLAVSEFSERQRPSRSFLFLLSGCYVNCCNVVSWLTENLGA